MIPSLKAGELEMNVSKLICVAALAAFVPLAVWADESADKKAVLEVLNRYEKALNASDTDGLTKLYVTDAVLMAPNSSPTVGQEMIRKVYDGLFKAVKIDIKFEIDEVQPLSEKWAFARTRSKFTVKVLGSDLPPQQDANQELFLLQKDGDGQWRIARYSYSSTNPPVKK
jgi:uncharacterized protein (TIGR02246 family)